MKARLIEICIAICVLALAPLVFLQMIHLWERPHFQFFPLAWLACAGLVFYRAKLQDTDNRWRHNFALMTWGLGVAAGVVAALFFSPWVAQAATILCLTGWGLFRLASISAARWLGWTLLLWITLPLPGELDADVVGGLQRLSAESAGGLLDLMGIAHLRTGTLIEIRAGKLFVDEACSGIDSLYSLAAIALLMMLVQERPLIVGLFTILTVPIWAWLGNVIRLTAIVFLLDRWGIDLSQGWKHTALGFVTFGISSLFLLSTLHGFAHFFRRFPLSSMPREREWHMWYNTLVCYPETAPNVADETDQYFVSSRAPQSPIEERQAQRATAPIRQRTWPLVAMVSLVSVGILGFNVRNLSRDWVDGRSTQLPHYELNQVTHAFTETGLPETLLQAKRIDFNQEHRSPESFLGEYSRSWVYRDSRCDFALAIDFPFRGYHPLWVCYTNSGKEMLGQPKPAVSQTSANAIPNVMHAKFKDDLGNASYLWFVLLEANGQTVPVKSYTQEQNENPFLARIKTVLADTIEREPVTYQFQLYVPSTRELNDAELAEYLAVFEAALPSARQQIQQLPKH